jgi:RNA polymerase sigma-70 factor (ECF subfamily)
MYANKSNEELLDLLKGDYEYAYNELYNRHWYSVYTIALQKLHRKDIAEEIAQDFFLSIWNKRHKLNIRNFKAYLTSSIRNQVIDYIRKNLHEAKYLDQLKHFVPPIHFGANEEVYYNELNDAMHTSLAKLPEKTREVYVLNRFEKLTAKEIAVRLNLSEKTIEYHLSRSNHFLRYDLQKFNLIWVLLLMLDL